MNRPANDFGLEKYAEKIGQAPTPSRIETLTTLMRQISEQAHENRAMGAKIREILHGAPTETSPEKQPDCVEEYAREALSLLSEANETLRNLIDRLA